jgi:hypothetical protein
VKGVKYDNDKPRFDLLPWREVEDVAKVLTFGAEKYEPDNWKRVDNSKSRYIAAAFRHLSARAQGELFDQETGLPHVAHAICCLLFLGWHDKQKAKK